MRKITSSINVVNAKRIYTGQASANAIMRGFGLFTDTLKTTMGPLGRNIATTQHNLGKDNKFLNKYFPKRVIFTNAGVTISQDFELLDSFDDSAADFLAQAAIRTATTTGDGTTTTTVLANAITVEGFKNVAAGANPMQMRTGIERAAQVAIDHILSSAYQIEGEEAIQRVAAIAAGDEELGSVIAEGVTKAKLNGICTIDESPTGETYVEYINGMQLDRGFVSPFFINNFSTMEVDYQNPYILLVEDKIADFSLLLPIMEQVRKVNGSLIIFADEVRGQALEGLIHNKRRGAINVAVLKIPAIGPNVGETLEDIACVTGATLITPQFGTTLENATLEMCGRAQRVRASEHKAYIIGGATLPDRLERRIKEIEGYASRSVKKYDIERHQRRLASLTGGIVTIYAGGVTETEIRATKLRMEDALSAVGAALQYGVVPGGGAALVEAIPTVEKLLEEDIPEDEKVGIRTFISAMSAPMIQIANNSGTDGSYVFHKVKDAGLPGYGYDVVREEYGNMMDLGIVDPAKVTCAAIHNASTVAALVLTSERFLQEDKDTDPKKNYRSRAQRSTIKK